TASCVCHAELSLPFPSLIKEIQPTISVYSPTGNPKCFRLVGGGTGTTRDIVALSNGQGAFDSERIIFIVHGFKDNENTEWLHVMKNALVKERQQTVVIFGWGGGSDLPNINYKKALANIQTSAIWLGEIITELRKMKPSAYIWGIGHSLGSHLLGLAGRSSPGAFDRITALDPAGPFLETRNLNLRLRRTDAAFCDVIHSDGCTPETNANCWVAPNNHYGTLVPLGSIDFYPRYGQVPPVTNPLDIYRSHERAVDLFILSITHQGLFRTNETLDGSPGIGQLIATRQVSVTAEMGYWANAAFIPGATDSRVNFYVNQEIMSVVDRNLSHAHKPGMKHHRKRDLAETIDCEALPSTGANYIGNAIVIASTLLSAHLLL
ncbi:Pancreatic triacylglycerol lipase, partial [Orchesella cincta]